MKKSKRFRDSLNFKLIIILYTGFLLIVCSLAIYYSYHERQNMYINKFNNTAELLEKEYTNVLENFWKIYMPVFEEQDTDYQVMYNYFSNEKTLSPIEKRDMAKVLKQMLMRDDRIQWLAIYRGEQSDNYILFSTSDTLVKLDEDFPFWQHLINKASQMEVYETKPVYNGDYIAETFAVSGGAMGTFQEGAILAGYDISCFSQYLDSYTGEDIHSDYMIKNTHGTVYNPSALCAYEDFTPTKNHEGVITLSNNKRYYTKSITYDGRLSFSVTYFTDWEPLFLHSVSTALLITTLFIVFSLVAFYLYVTEIKNMSQKG